jgi:hypothetical protein
VDPAVEPGIVGYDAVTGEVRAGVATGDVPLGDDAVWLTAHDDLVIYRLPTA